MFSLKMKNFNISKKNCKYCQIVFGRTMKVNINNYSETHNILSNILQESVLELLFLIFMNDLPNDIKSEMELFADHVKQLVILLSKEITQMNKFSY